MMERSKSDHQHTSASESPRDSDQEELSEDNIPSQQNDETEESDSENEAQKFEPRNSDTEAEEEEEEDILNLDEDDDDSAAEVTDPDAQIKRLRSKLKEAQATISSLVGNIGEYKSVLDQEKRALEEENAKLKQSNEADKGKLDVLVAELRENEEVAEELVGKIKQLEEDRSSQSLLISRKNKENMENLATLLKEMTYIEEMNEGLNRELETFKDKSKESDEKVKTSAQIIDQLDLKVQRQEQQIIKLTEQLKEMQSSSPGSAPVVDLNAIASLQSMQDDSLVKEVIRLKQALQEEKDKVASIDNFLMQARRISSAGNLRDSAEGSLYFNEKQAHSEALKQLDEERQKVEADKQTIDRLQRRIKDLIQSHTSTLAQLDEERSAVKKAQEEAGSLADKLTATEKTLKEESTKKKPTPKPEVEPAPKSSKENRQSVLFKITKDKKGDTSKKKKDGPLIISDPTFKGSTSDLQLLLGISEKEKPLLTSQSTTSVPSAALAAPPLAHSNSSPTIAATIATPSAPVLTRPHSPSLDSGKAPPATSRDRASTINIAPTPGKNTPEPAEPADGLKSWKLRLKGRYKGKDGNSSHDEKSDGSGSEKESRKKNSMTWGPRNQPPRLEVSSPPEKNNGNANGHSADKKPETETVKRTRPLSMMATTSLSYSQDDAINVWEEFKDREGKLFWTNAATGTISRRSPFIRQRGVSNANTLNTIFNALGAGTVDLSAWAKDRTKEKKIIKAQAATRGWISRRNFKEMVKLGKLKQTVLHELLESERNYVRSLDRVVKDYLIPCREKNVLKVQTIQTIFSSVELILNCAKDMLEQFEQRIANWHYNQEVGDIFLKLVPSVDVYTSYCDNYQHALSIMQSKNFATIITKISKKQDAKTSLSFVLELPSLLVLPVYHLPKYKSVLQELIKYTLRRNPDWILLTESLHQISTGSSKLNENVKERQNAEHMMRVQKTFTGSPELKTPGRYFVRDGSLIKLCRKIPKPRWFVLFNDALMYGSREKEDTNSKVKFHRLINLSDSSQVRDIPDMKNSTPNGFQIITNFKSFIVYADSSELKRSWLQSLQTVINDLNTYRPTGDAGRKAIELAPVWMHDNEANQCTLCGEGFTVIKRRHHCRRCGRLVCGSCSENKVKLPNQGTSRVCDDCYEKLGGTVKNTQRAAKRKSYRQSVMVGTTFTKAKVVSFWALPEKVVCMIFGNLDPRSLACVALVCRTWNRLAAKDPVWYSLFLRRWNEPEQPEDRTWKQRYHIEQNWESQRNTCEILKGHTASITSVSFKGNQLLSGSVDTKLHLWDLTTNKFLRSYRGHTNSVRCVQIDPENNLIASGSEDKTVKIWEFETGRNIQTLKDGGEVTCLQLDVEKNLLYNGSSDKTVKVWDTRSWKLIKTLKAHTNKVFCLQAQGNTLVSGSQDKTVRLWDIAGGRCLNTLKGHTDTVRCVQFDEDKIISGSDDGTVKVYNLTEGELTISAHPGEKVTCLQFDANRLVTGGSDGCMKVWKLGGHGITPAYSMDCKAGWIRSLQYSQEILVSGHGDNNVRVWKFLSE